MAKNWRVRIGVATAVVGIAALWQLWRGGQWSLTERRTLAPAASSLPGPASDPRTNRDVPHDDACVAPGRGASELHDARAIRGRIVDRVGNGVVGARVFAIPDTESRTAAPDDIRKCGIGVETVSSANGHFTMMVASGAPAFAVVAQARGFATRSVSALPGTDTLIVLDEGPRLVGRVLEMDGTPIVGARVSVRSLVCNVRVEPEALSGPGGHYRLDGLSIGPFDFSTFWCLIVTRDGFAPLLVDRTGWAQPTEQTLDLVMVRGSTLVGRVCDDETGAPIADARVILWSIEGSMTRRVADGDISSPWSPRALAEVTSKSDGSFRFEHVPSSGFHRIHTSEREGELPVVCRVGTWKEGFAWTCSNVPAVANGGLVERELRVRPSIVIEGRVVSANGAPSAGARVVAERGIVLPSFLSAVVPCTVCTTDTMGCYQLTIAVPRSASATVSVEATALDDGRVVQGKVEVGTRAGEKSTAPDIVVSTDNLARAPSHGREVRLLILVRDPTGAPVHGATLEGFDQALTRARSDRSGRLATSFIAQRALPSIPARRAVVRARGFGGVVIEIPWDPLGDVEIRVTLGSVHRVTGRIIVADGAPAPGVRVTICDGSLPVAQALANVSGSVRRGESLSTAQSLVDCDTFAAADGSFQFDNIPDGRYYVIASGSAMSPRAGAAPSPTVVSIDASDATSLVMRIATDTRPPAARLLGTVVDAVTGRPVGAFDVRVDRSRESADAAPSPKAAWEPQDYPEKSSVGCFRIIGLAPGTYDVEVRAPSYTVARANGIAVGAGDTEVSLRLSRGVHVRGVVKLPSGMVARDRIVLFDSLDGVAEQVSFPVRPDGTFEGSGLAPGRYRVLALPSNGWLIDRDPPALLRERDEEVLLDDGATDVTVDLNLVEAATLSLTLVDPRLPPNAESSVPATAEQRAFGKASTLTVMEIDGRIRATDSLGDGRVHRSISVLPGEYVARLLMPGSLVIEAQVHAEAGRLIEVTLRAK